MNRSEGEWKMRMDLKTGKNGLRKTQYIFNVPSTNHSSTPCTDVVGEGQSRVSETGGGGDGGQESP